MPKSLIALIAGAAIGSIATLLAGRRRERHARLLLRLMERV